MSLIVVQHPLAKHLMTHLRDKNTNPEQFRMLCRKLTTILVLEATRQLETLEVSIETPLEATIGHVLQDGLAVIPILRAGLGMLEPILELFPNVAVGYVGLERNHETAIANSYYCKLPSAEKRHALIIDPMLATGGSAEQAIALVKKQEPKSVALLCIVSAPEGVERLTNNHPDVPIYTAALDRELNDVKYILPGLGDFGDRLYGT